MDHVEFPNMNTQCTTSFIKLGIPLQLDGSSNLLLKAYQIDDFGRIAMDISSIDTPSECKLEVRLIDLIRAAEYILKSEQAYRVRLQGNDLTSVQFEYMGNLVIVEDEQFRLTYTIQRKLGS